MPSIAKSYKDGKRSMLEVCPLAECVHDTGKKTHWIFEYPDPKRQSKADFEQEAFAVVENEA